MSDREWRFYIDDMMGFAEKVLTTQKAWIRTVLPSAV